MTIENVTLHLYRRTGGYMHGDLAVENFDWRRIPDCMKDRVHLGAVEVQVEVPDLDMRPLLIQQLEEEIRQVRADSEAKVCALKERISKLQAITHEDYDNLF